MRGHWGVLGVAMATPSCGSASPASSHHFSPSLLQDAPLSLQTSVPSKAVGALRERRLHELQDGLPTSVDWPPHGVPKGKLEVAIRDMALSPLHAEQVDEHAATVRSDCAGPGADEPVGRVQREGRPPLSLPAVVVGHIALALRPGRGARTLADSFIERAFLDGVGRPRGERGRVARRMRPSGAAF